MGDNDKLVDPLLEESKMRGFRSNMCCSGSGLSDPEGFICLCNFTILQKLLFTY